MNLRLLMFAVLAAILIVPSVAGAAENTGTLTGTVHATSGAPIANASIIASGPVARQTSTDAAGKFTMTLPAGLYRLDASKGGFLSATQTDLTVLAGGNLPVDVTMQQADLGSLKTIARVTTSARSSINTGAAAIAIVGRQEFANLASPQINDVVERIPGADIEKGSSSPNTSFTVAGAQGYETQVLVDGHPVSIGRYGVWFSQFFNSFLVGNVEAQLGPGNTTPFAGTAVGGTINISTPGYTKNGAYHLVTGMDSLAGSYSNALYSGSIGKLSYVAGLGTAGINTPFTGTYGCVLNADNKKTWNTPGATATVSFCGDLGGGQYNKGELLKAKWDFSPTTSFEFGFLGSQAGYNPQGSAYGLLAPNITVVNCLTLGSGATQHQECTNPQYAGMAGQKINGLFFYPGSAVSNNMPLFTGQFRTALGENTLLVRPYGGSITRIIDGSGEANYGIWWYPKSDVNAPAACKKAFGAPMVLPTGTMDVCQDTAYTTVETDKLRGATLSFIHPMGLNQLEFNYDYHSDETYAIAGNPVGLKPAVPNTMEKYNTLSLTGDFALSRQLTLKAGAYQNWWYLNGWAPTVSGIVPFQRTVGSFDPHLAFTYQPHGGESLRLALGTSTTFPYAGIVSGSAYTTPGATGTVALNGKNPMLSPEKAYEADLGFDKRMWDGSILSLDLIDTQVHNVFENSSMAVTGQPYSVIYEPLNAANLSSELAMLTWRREPLVGWGYRLSVTANRAVPTGIPLPMQDSSKKPLSYALPANGVQQCSDGGSAVCVPYLKGYAALEYTFADRTFAHLGVNYQGKNNTYFQPPFAIWDLTLRRPIPKSPLSFQATVYNLFDTNNFGGLVTPNAGTALTGEAYDCPSSPAGTPCSYKYGTYTQSVPFPLIPVQGRTLRVQIDYNVGGR
ncbi:MAG TPA: TonB-dependent receptor [Candidatus Baltobacteraceae bacterium]|nr:TonB-dependent receptor [Candidatus Baltobacteraceae bacterium]